MGLLTERLSFDIGSSTLRIVKNGKLVLEEDCRIELNTNGEIVAYGNDISENGSNRIINPIQTGAIYDFNGIEQLLRQAIKKVPNHRKFLLPPSLVTMALVQEFSSEVELRAVRDCLEHAGSRNTHMIYSGFATAKGIGLDKKGTFLILDAGAGKISTTVYSGDQLHCPHRLYFGAIKLKEIIALYINQHHGVNCNQAILEEILTNYISALNDLAIETKRLTCPNTNHSFELDLKQLNQRLIPYFQQIDDEILLTINTFKQQNSKSIQSVVFTGGLSRINGLEKRISQLTELPILNKSDKNYTIRGLELLDADFESNEKAMK